ncbi:hypothetical protein [Thetidibacter halocola]|uniref:DUF885 domain-containing protein n=1 Tax=Thetidibacter halocola TaxID=2827239 RepID=A0A8J8B8U8_9RHOB|nr:hypothetical protein [Thetidibacter halocola]MBS0125149.1 hypothetical protein [Thetidibacter halocola]
MTFTNSGATRADPRIAEIAQIKDAAERARTLFAYLEDWVPPGTGAAAPETPDQVEGSRATAPLPALPPQRPAPLVPRFEDGQLVRGGGAPLSSAEAERRAEDGWQALKRYVGNFRDAFEISNNAPLLKFLDQFEAAMGEAYDPRRSIEIGMAGQRLVRLSRNAAFLRELPLGADDDLKGFAEEIDRYADRFQDWLDYKADRDTAGRDAAKPETVRAARDDYLDVAEALRTSPEVEAGLARDYRDAVDAATGPDADDIAASGLDASTREIGRAIGEKALQEITSGTAARREIDAMDAVHDQELAKWKWRLGGFAVVFLRRQGPALRRLALRFPSSLGWLENVLDYIGAD